MHKLYGVKQFMQNNRIPNETCIKFNNKSESYFGNLHIGGFLFKDMMDDLERITKNSQPSGQAI